MSIIIQKRATTTFVCLYVKQRHDCQPNSCLHQCLPHLWCKLLCCYHKQMTLLQQEKTTNSNLQSSLCALFMFAKNNADTTTLAYTVVVVNRVAFSKFRFTRYVFVVFFCCHSTILLFQLLAFLFQSAIVVVIAALDVSNLVAAADFC